MGETIRVEEQRHDLGAVICRECRSVISTLPTSGVKKVFSICQSCLQADVSDCSK